MVVGVCRLALMAPNARSLKDKRAVLRRIKDKTQAKFHVPVAEVGGQDTWQRAVLGFAVVGGDRAHVESVVAAIAGFIERLGEAPVLGVERDYVSYGEEPMGDGAWRSAAQAWDPDPVGSVEDLAADAGDEVAGDDDGEDPS